MRTRSRPWYAEISLEERSEIVRRRLLEGRVSDRMAAIFDPEAT
jgi:hypothetical protein